MSYVMSDEEFFQNAAKIEQDEKNRQYWIAKEKEAIEKYSPPGIEFFKSLIPGQIEPAPEGAPDAISSDIGLIDPVELAVDLTPVGMAAGIGLGALKKVDKALPSVSGFTSKLEDVIRQKMSGKATAEEIGAMVKQAGVKQEELEDIAFEQWLQGTENQLFDKQRKSSIEPSTSVQTPKIQKEDVLNYLQAERPELKEIKYGVMPEQYKKVSEEFVLLGQEKENYETYLKLFHTPEYVSGIKDEIQRSLNTNTDIRDLITDRSYAYGKNLYLKASESGSNMTFEQAKGVIRNYITTLNQRKNLATALQSYAKNYPQTRWKSFSLSNQGIGENYREYVYKYEPTKRTEAKDFFRSEGHWPGVENPVYHIRAQDLTDKDGDKLLNVDEIQSDVHQYGQKFGYKKREMTGEETQKIIDVLIENDLMQQKAQSFRTSDLINKAMYLPDEEFAKIQPIFKEAGLAVDLPFKKTWHEQAMRRMIKEALDSGKDGVSWTAGSVQAKRAEQDLGEVTSIAYDPARYHLSAYRGDDNIFDRNVPLQKLSQYVGSGIAKQFKDGAAKQLAERKAWKIAQQKQDDAAIEKYREWLTDKFGEAGAQNPPLIDTTLKSNLNTLRDYSSEPDASAKVYDQMEKAGLTPIQISDLRSQRIKYPPRMDLIEVPATAESFGGSGMKKFYDEKVVNFARQEAKRLGGTVTQTAVKSSAGEEIPIWKFKFGPKTKEAVKEKGVPLYVIPTAVGLSEVVKEMKKEEGTKK